MKLSDRTARNADRNENRTAGNRGPRAVRTTVRMRIARYGRTVCGVASRQRTTRKRQRGGPQRPKGHPLSTTSVISYHTAPTPMGKGEQLTQGKNFNNGPRAYARQSAAVVQVVFGPIRRRYSSIPANNHYMINRFFFLQG